MKESPNSAQQLLATFGLGERDLASLRALQRTHPVPLEQLTEEFQHWLATADTSEQFFPYGVHEALKESQVSYWREFLTANVTDEYIRSRARLGAVHAELGIPIRAYLAGMNFSLLWLHRFVASTSLEASMQQKVEHVIIGLCQLDAAVISESYSKTAALASRLDHSRSLAIMNGSLDPLITTDAQGTIQFASTSTMDMFGWSPEELVGQPIDLLLPDLSRNSHDSSHEAPPLALTIVGAPRELIGLRRSGERFDAELCFNQVEVAGTHTAFCVGVIRDISERKEKERQLTRVSLGDLSAKVMIRGPHDGLGTAINQMIDSLTAIVEQVNTISQGDYSAKIVPRSNNDALGVALRDMTDTLKRTADENHRESWLKTGLANLTESIRGESETTALIDKALATLAPYLNAQVGVLYVCDQGSTELRLCGSYAYHRSKSHIERIVPGEGILGQAAKEKKGFVLEQVPPNHISVDTGLGASTPRSIVVMPILHEDVVKGVVEFGSFETFSNEDHELLRRAGETLAIAINASQDREQLARTLEQAQTIADELQSQKLELSDANRRLNEQQQELKNINNELAKQSEELKYSGMELLASNQELAEKGTLLEQERREVEEKNENLLVAQARVEEKARDLALASKYKSEFLANMSHELRTPLNSLLILSNSLSKNKDGNLTPQQVEKASIIHDGGKDLLNLINDILDLSKVEAGKLEVQWEAVSTDSIARHLKRNFSPVAEQKGLVFEIVIEPHLPKTFESDGHRVQQIVRNLAANAFKFTESGAVTIHFRSPQSSDALQDQVLAGNKTLSIAVIDTGIGIPAAKQRGIFEAFQQADGSTSRRFGGTGLGLTISRELSRVLGGEITIESQDGAGSTFTLHLPFECGTPKSVAPSPQAAPPTFPVTAKPSAPVPGGTPAVPSSAPPPNTETVLIIEDDSVFVERLTEYANSRGFECLVASDGLMGLKIAAQHLPGGILLDIEMPLVDGLVVLDLLKANISTCDIPVHVVSASNQQERALQLGAEGFLRKPVDEKVLSEAFDSFHSKLRPRPRSVLVLGQNVSSAFRVESALADSSCRTVVADSAAQTETLLADRHFDCVVVEFDPESSFGMEFLSRFTSSPNAGSTCLVVYCLSELSPEGSRALGVGSRGIFLAGEKCLERFSDKILRFLNERTTATPSPQPGPVPTAKLPHDFLKGRTILVVDDDMRNTFALSSALQESACNVLPAANGKLALEVLSKTSQVDLVLMDIMMPVMNGFEAIQGIRNDERHADLPVIALTALATSQDRQQCMASGASDYLTKPVDMDELNSKLLLWLEKPTL